MAQMGPKEVENFTEENVSLLRHMVFNCLRSYRQKFGQEFGELVICTDSRSWRKDVFQHYKAHRNSERQVSKIDWGLIFDTLHQILIDIRTYFPYIVISVEKAEADDVIAVLCELSQQSGGENMFGSEAEPVLILSGDKDFQQLQKYSNVKQWATVQKKWIKPKDWKLQLRELIVQGDKGDGIPNFRSPGDTFVNHIRQKKVMKNKLKEYLTKDPKDFCTDQELVWFKRNEELIDFTYIPESVRIAIQQEYASQCKLNTGKNRMTIMSYFMKHRMKNMIELAGDF
jgi:hypothetical protein